MKISVKALFLILVAAAVIYLYLTDVLLAPGLSQQTKPEVCYKEACFSVELAETSAEREKGLMFRAQLGQDKGMLFIFDKEDIYPFWMKNTLIPLDIIWINSDNKAVFIGKNIQPCLPAQAGKSFICPMVAPPVKARYVLEVNAGLAEKIELKIGDEIKIIP